MTEHILPPTLARRRLLRLLAGAAGCVGLSGGVLFAGARALAAEVLDFDDLYAKITVLGLEFSEKVKQAKGKAVTMRGYMAPPLKAEAKFFVLTKIPMSICPFCSSDSDWPDDIVVIYLRDRQTFVQYNAPIEVSGTLDVGSWIDPETGFVSQLRLNDARFRPV
ncbi:MAG TPA: hypothetical protein PLK13_04800 [Xanthobacteraceae bacterium]|jgi:hypothetical protein|nr:MAG: hypothetical protein B7Z40_23105 [Bosea sp. 12-68-7]HQS08124.1 hypothetical protein [Xanthobacteraceae bacterium]HQS49822.1 hypothetical protein [Xanthobacteraceae bacterium]